MNVINCKKIRDLMLTTARQKIKKISEPLKLVIIQVGNNDASNTYIRNKLKTAEEVGIATQLVKCSHTIGTEDLKQIIIDYNNRPDVTGLMIQLPLPAKWTTGVQDILDCISWYKDVDGLTSESFGRLWTGRECITPATPTGIMRLLPEDLSGKKVTIVNRSNLIGKPLAKMLLDRNATVTICHSKTTGLSKECADADIVVTGTGKPKMFNGLKSSIVKNQIWIDCGINRDENGKLCGDIDVASFKAHSKLYSAHTLTTVPGGVGVLTTAQLMLNVIKAYEIQKKIYDKYL